jgi:hypothetical protein
MCYENIQIDKTKTYKGHIKFTDCSILDPTIFIHTSTSYKIASCIIQGIKNIKAKKFIAYYKNQKDKKMTYLTRTTLSHARSYFSYNL